MPSSGSFRKVEGHVLSDRGCGGNLQDSPVIYGNGTGDTFTFEVYRCATGTVSFRSEQAEPLCQPLVQNLTNGPHTVEIISTGDGEVRIEALYVFQPPIKD